MRSTGEAGVREAYVLDARLVASPKIGCKSERRVTKRFDGSNPRLGAAAGIRVVFAVDNSRRIMGLRGRSLPMWTTHFAEPAVHTIKRNDSAHVPAGTSRRSESEHYPQALM